MPLNLKSLKFELALFLLIQEFLYFDFRFYHSIKEFSNFKHQ